jgi:hypothetical protein
VEFGRGRTLFTLGQGLDRATLLGTINNTASVAGVPSFGNCGNSALRLARRVMSPLTRFCEASDDSQPCCAR